MVRGEREFVADAASLRVHLPSMFKHLLVTGAIYRAK